MKQRGELGALTQVIVVDAAAGTVDAEGLVSYRALVDATLPYGVMPAVVPTPATTTVAQAITGIGIEATSFREGLVHDTLLEADVLLGSGKLTTCRPDNEHRGRFLALPKSFGALGYLTRARLRTRPVGPVVHVQHRRLASVAQFFAALEAAAAEPGVEFLDGMLFGSTDLVLDVARFARHAPAGALSEHGSAQTYRRSQHAGSDDWLTVHDWLWRRDPGAGRSAPAMPRGVELPLQRAVEFARLLLQGDGRPPIWICPIREADPALPFTLCPRAPRTSYVHFALHDTAGLTHTS
jgi:FAD/FMN-containing dehydrogenase